MDLDTPREEVMKNVDVLLLEIRENGFLKKRSVGIYNFTKNDRFVLYQKISWVISLIINLVILSTYRLNELQDGDSGRGDRKLERDGFELGINIASFVFAGLNFAILMMWIIFKSTIVYTIKKTKYNEKHGYPENSALGFLAGSKLYIEHILLKSKFAVSFLLHTAFALLGALLDPFFHTLHLLLYTNISDSAMYIL